MHVDKNMRAMSKVAFYIWVLVKKVAFPIGHTDFNFLNRLVEDGGNWHELSSSRYEKTSLPLVKTISSCIHFHIRNSNHQ